MPEAQLTHASIARMKQELLPMLDQDEERRSIMRGLAQERGSQRPGNQRESKRVSKFVELSRLIGNSLTKTDKEALPLRILPSRQGLGSRWRIATLKKSRRGIEGWRGSLAHAETDSARPNDAAARTIGNWNFRRERRASLFTNCGLRLPCILRRGNRLCVMSRRSGFIGGDLEPQRRVSDLLQLPKRVRLSPIDLPHSALSPRLRAGE
jgi:hypothetical protein